jgi:hypothetical protein
MYEGVLGVLADGQTVSHFVLRPDLALNGSTFMASPAWCCEPGKPWVVCGSATPDLLLSLTSPPRTPVCFGSTIRAMTLQLNTLSTSALAKLSYCCMQATCTRKRGGVWPTPVLTASSTSESLPAGYRGMLAARALSKPIMPLKHVVPVSGFALSLLGPNTIRWRGSKAPLDRLATSLGSRVTVELRSRLATC